MTGVRAKTTTKIIFSHVSQKTFSVIDPSAVLPLPVAPIVHTPIEQPMISTFNSEIDLRFLGTDMVSYYERCDAILGKMLFEISPNSIYTL